MKKEIFYKTTGFVAGICWGGGIAGYPAREYNGTNLKALLNEIEEAFRNGSLDSGFGFMKLQAATVEIEKLEKRNISGKDFFHKSYETKNFGNEELLEEFDFYNY